MHSPAPAAAVLSGAAAPLEALLHSPAPAAAALSGATAPPAVALHDPPPATAAPSGVAAPVPAESSSDGYGTDTSGDREERAYYLQGVGHQPPASRKGVGPLPVPSVHAGAPPVWPPLHPAARPAPVPARPLLTQAWRSARLSVTPPVASYANSFQPLAALGDAESPPESPMSPPRPVAMEVDSPCCFPAPSHPVPPGATRCAMEVDCSPLHDSPMGTIYVMLPPVPAGAVRGRAPRPSRTDAPPLPATPLPPPGEPSPQAAPSGPTASAPPGPMDVDPLVPAVGCGQGKQRAGGSAVLVPPPPWPRLRQPLASGRVELRS